MSTTTRVHDTGTVQELGDVVAFLDGIAFPAERADLLLHAIERRETPRLIDALRALPDVLFPDTAAVLGALDDR